MSRSTSQTSYDRAAMSYGQVGPPLFAHFGQRLADLAELRPGMTVLDVAAGTGAVTLPGAERVGSGGLVLGIDASIAMLRQLKEAVAARRLTNVHACALDAEHVDALRTKFDSVLCGFAIDSLRNPELTLSRCRGILKKGGTIALSLAPGWWWEGDHRWFWHEELLESLGVSTKTRHERLWTAGDIAILLEQANFERVSVISEHFRLSFTSPNEWWRWIWSHGFRQVLEQMDQSQLAKYEAACYAELEKMPGKQIEGQLQVFICLARA